MENKIEMVQKLFDEVSARTGMPRVDFTRDNSAALPFGEGMLLYLHFREEIPEIDFTVPLGGVPRNKRAAVYESLLAANFYWVGANGATLSYNDSLEEVIIQFREDTTHLTPERLQGVLEGFLAVSIKWREKLAKLIATSGEEDDDDEDAKPDSHGTGHHGFVTINV